MERGCTREWESAQLLSSTAEENASLSAGPWLHGSHLQHQHLSRPRDTRCPLALCNPPNLRPYQMTLVPSHRPSYSLNKREKTEGFTPIFQLRKLRLGDKAHTREHSYRGHS